MFADEPIKESDTNTVSLRREITIIDVNDNPPEFLGRPYSFSVPENAPVGTIIYNNITVVDKDVGSNGEISMTCFQNNEPCVTFNLLTEKVCTAFVVIIVVVVCQVIQPVVLERKYSSIFGMISENNFNPSQELFESKLWNSLEHYSCVFNRSPR